MVEQCATCYRVAYCLKLAARTSFAQTLWLTWRHRPVSPGSTNAGHQHGQTTIYMAPSSIAKPKKEKVFHPSSRKAGQLARNALRKGKLGNLAAKRTQKHHSLGLLILDFSSSASFSLATSRFLWIFLSCNARRRGIVAARFASHYQRHLVESV